ncbi:Plbd1, partial [Symbiodinium sp. KB8]
VTGSLPTVFEEWFAKQDSWARQQVAAHPHDSYWQHVDTVLHQLDGLVAGYAAVAPPSEALTRFNLAALNGVGDLIDLLNVLMPSTRPAWEAMAPEEVMRDFSELFQGHSSWFVFQGMLRIMKSYHFQLANPTTGSHDTTFSSYPGYLSSLDDFYTNFESGIIMTQTTNNIFNHSLYSLVVPESLLAWQRVRLANQIATSGAQWMEIAATHNSGTYNNAYLVTDLKKWTAKAALVPGLFTYGEQIPGEFQWQDTTETLAQSGFWASYNVPYFRDIYEKSGYASIVQAHAGNETSAQVLSGLQYQMAPRAKIVRRQAGAIADMVDYKAFMRFNEFKSDPYAAGNPFAAICSRGDLAATHASTSGCYDTKVTSASWFQEYKAQIVNGPTWGKWSGKDNLPAFSWSEQGGKFAGLSHEGMPDTFATDFVDHTPQWREW